MSLHSKSIRAVAASAVAVLAAGAVVAVTSTAAQAAVSASTTYDCTGVGAVGLAVEQSILTDGMTFPAGLDVPADFLGVDLDATISEATTTALRTLGVTQVGGSSDDMTLSVVAAGGSTPVGSIGVVDVVFPPADVPASGSMTLSTPPADGSNGVPASLDAFNAPPAGTYDINFPPTFSFVATDGSGNQLADSTCTLQSGAEDRIATLTFTKNASTTTGKVVNPPVEKGTRGKIRTTVAAENETPSGKVVAKKGSQTIGSGMLNDKGKVTITLDRLPVGKHSVVLKYKGDGYTAKSSSETITVKVVN